LFGLAAAVALAGAIWLVAEFVFGVPLHAPAGNGYPEPVRIDLLTVAIAAAVLSLVGWGLLASLERLTSRAKGIWLVLALLGLAGSLFMPLSGTGVSTTNRVLLVTMHLAVAAVLIPVLYRTSRSRAENREQSAGAVARRHAA
jgi:hypothetical protein